MPTVKIHIPSGTLIFEKPILVKEIRKALEEITAKDGSTAECCQVILYETLPQHRSIAPDKDSSFIFVEILLQTGTAASLKKQLMKSICTIISEQAEVALEAVSCCIIEYDADNCLTF